MVIAFLVNEAVLLSTTQHITLCVKEKTGVYGNNCRRRIHARTADLSAWGAHRQALADKSAVRQ